MFRFTIRDLLCLMVIVALGVGWCVNRSGLLDNIGIFMPIYSDDPPPRVRQFDSESQDSESIGNQAEISRQQLIAHDP